MATQQQSGGFSGQFDILEALDCPGGRIDVERSNRCGSGSGIEFELELASELDAGTVQSGIESDTEGTGSAGFPEDQVTGQSGGSERSKLDGGADEEVDFGAGDFKAEFAVDFDEVDEVERAAAHSDDVEARSAVSATEFRGSRRHCKG